MLPLRVPTVGHPTQGEDGVEEEGSSSGKVLMGGIGGPAVKVPCGRM
jgi:hypothetical protein